MAVSREEKRVVRWNCNVSFRVQTTLAACGQFKLANGIMLKGRVMRMMEEANGAEEGRA